MLKKKQKIDPAVERLRSKYPDLEFDERGELVYPGNPAPETRQRMTEQAAFAGLPRSAVKLTTGHRGGIGKNPFKDQRD